MQSKYRLYRSLFMRTKLPYLLVLCLWFSIRAADAPFTMSDDEQAIVDQTNAERAKSGQAPLKPNATLFSVARKHAADMAEAKKLEHRLHGKNSGDRVTAAGYKWVRVSENIAWNQRNVSEVVNGWMCSEGHRANLLNSEITEIGVGIAANSLGELYWVQDFARPEVPEVYTPRPVPIEPGAVKTTLTFWIHNISNDTMNVDVRAEKLFVLKPGEKTQYNLTTMSSKPPVEVKSGITSLEFTAQEGGTYTVNKHGNDMTLKQSVPFTR